MTDDLLLLHSLQTADPTRYAVLSDALTRLLNDQWPRSIAARTQSFASLHDDLPVFLLLVDRDDGALLAACKLSRVGSVSLPVGGDLAVPSEPDRCVLLENVIVDRAKRRGGLGRRLMAAMERFAASRGFTAVVLVTNDQVPFYTRCGYAALPSGVAYAPASSSASKLNAQQLGSLLAVFGAGPSSAPEPAAPTEPPPIEATAAPAAIIALPPPPPPPPLAKRGEAATSAASEETWMAKRIDT